MVVEKRNRGHLFEVEANITEETIGNTKIFSFGSLEIIIRSRSTWANHEHGQRRITGEYLKNTL